MANPTADDFPDMSPGTNVNSVLDIDYDLLAKSMNPQTEESQNFLRVLSSMTDVNSALAILNDTSSSIYEDQVYWNARFGSRLGQIYRMLDSNKPVTDNRGSTEEWELWRGLATSVDKLTQAITVGPHAVAQKATPGEEVLAKQIELMEVAVAKLSRVDLSSSTAASAPPANYDTRSFRAMVQTNSQLLDLRSSVDALKATAIAESNALTTHMDRLSAREFEEWSKVVQPLAIRDEKFQNKVAANLIIAGRLLTEIREVLRANSQGNGGPDLDDLRRRKRKPGRGPKGSSPDIDAKPRNGGSTPDLPDTKRYRAVDPSKPGSNPRGTLPNGSPRPSVPSTPTPEVPNPAGGGFFSSLKNKAGDLWSKGAGWFTAGEEGLGTATKFGMRAAKGLKASAPMAALMAVPELYDNFTDDTKSNEEKAKGTVSTAAGVGGSMAGAAAGAAVGSIIPGVGTAIGGLVGFLAGGYLGGEAAKAGANKLMGVDETGHNVVKPPPPPADNQKAKTAHALPASATATAAHPANTNQAEAVKVAGEAAAQQGAGRKVSDKNKESQAALNTMRDPNSKFGSVDQSKIDALFANQEKNNAAGLKATSAQKDDDFNAMLAKSGVVQVPYISNETKNPQILQAAYAPKQADLAPPISQTTSANVTALTNPNASEGLNFASAATSALAAVTGSTRAQAGEFSPPPLPESHLEKTRQTNILAQPLKDMNQSMTANMTGFREEQLDAANKANEEQKSFFTQALSLFPPIALLTKAAEIFADPKAFWEKSKAVGGDLWDAAKAGTKNAINIFNGSNNERTAGQPDNRSIWQKTKDAVSGGWNAAKGTFNSAPTASSNMTDFTARHESGGRGYSALNKNDVGGIAYGKIQFNSRSGKLANVVDDYLANGDKSSANYQTIAKYRDAIKSNNMGVISKATDLHKALEGAGSESAMKSAQDKVVMQEYGNPALKAAGSAGLKSLAAQQVLFDTKVNGGMEDVMSSTKAKMGGKVGDVVNGQKITEKDFLHEYVNQRKQRLLRLADKKEANGDSKSARDLRAVAGTRMDELHGLVDKGSDVLADSTGAVSVTQNGKIATTTGGVIDPKAGHRYNGDVKAAPKDAGSGLIKKANDTMYAATQEAINKGVKYNFGSKSSASGGIDCSGWVAELNSKMMDSVNQATGQAVFSAKDKSALKDSSEGIIKNIGQKTGSILNNEQLAQTGLREGMVIGMDTGKTKFDQGREMGIDHIVNVVRDPTTNELMVSESRGGKGVSMTKASDWMERQNRKGTKLYGTDPLALADKGRAAALEAAAGKGGATPPTTAADGSQVMSEVPPGMGVPGAVPGAEVGTATATGTVAPTGDAGGVLYQAGVMLQQAAAALAGLAGVKLDPSATSQPPATEQTNPAQAAAAGTYAMTQNGAPVVAAETGTAVSLDPADPNAATKALPPLEDNSATKALPPLEDPNAATKALPPLEDENSATKALPPADEPDKPKPRSYTEVINEDWELSDGRKIPVQREVTYEEQFPDADGKQAGADQAPAQTATPEATTPAVGSDTKLGPLVPEGTGSPLILDPTLKRTTTPVPASTPTPVLRSVSNVPPATPMTPDSILSHVGGILSAVTSPASSILNIASKYNPKLSEASGILGSLGNLSTQGLFGSNLPISRSYEALRSVGSIPLTTDPAALGGWIAPNTMDVFKSVTGFNGGSSEGAMVPQSQPYNLLSTPGFNPAAGGGSSPTQAISNTAQTVLGRAGGIANDVSRIGSLFGKQVIPEGLSRVLGYGIPSMSGVMQQVLGGTKAGRVLDAIPDVNSILSALPGMGGMQLPGLGDIGNILTSGADSAIGSIMSSGKTPSFVGTPSAATPTPASVMGFPDVGSDASLPSKVYTTASVNTGATAPLPASSNDVADLTSAVAGINGEQKSPTPTPAGRSGSGSSGRIGIDELSLMLDEAQARMIS